MTVSRTPIVTAPAATEVRVAGKVRPCAPSDIEVFQTNPLDFADESSACSGTKVQAALKEEGIPTAVHYPLPLHFQPAFAALGHAEDLFPVSEAAGRCVLNLPMHPYLTEEEQRGIARALKEAAAAKVAVM